MRVRAIDMVTNDWTFGKGKSNYKSGIPACAQNVKTALQCFLGDCFFANQEGLDWFTYMGGKNTLEFKLAVAAIMLKVPDVISIEEISTNRDTSRKITIRYSLNTIYGKLNQQTLTQEVQYA